jgi:hypothetical protein
VSFIFWYGKCDIVFVFLQGFLVRAMTCFG